MRLLRVEVERSLRRRMVWMLLVVASVGIALFGILAFVTSTELDGEAHPALVRTWWGAGGDGPLTVLAVFLLLGGLIGGAGVVGGEWRAGNVAALLTWEPRRQRLLAARLAAVGLCSFVLAVVLQAVALAAAIPAVVAHGSAEGVDAAVAAGIVLAVVRIALLTSTAALVGGAAAWISRNTAVAIVAVWGWLALGETLLRARRPSMSSYLIGENLSRVLLWDDLGPDVAGEGGPLRGLLLLAIVVAGLIALAAVVFARTDATQA
jgi:ABC-2 type transport system permease protein